MIKLADKGLDQSLFIDPCLDLGLGSSLRFGLGFYIQGTYCQELRLGIRLRYLRFKVRIGLEFKVDLWFRIGYMVVVV